MLSDILAIERAKIAAELLCLQLSQPLKHAEQIAIGICFVLALTQVLTNLLTFGGDPEIHLIFAQNLLNGHPLQFNPGMFSSGETSLLYMLMVALFMMPAGVFGAAVSMKALGVLSGLALLLIVRRETTPMLGSTQATLFVALLAALPFFMFQASLGMENMPFACAMAFLGSRCLTGATALRQRLALGFAAHLLFFLRPEAGLLVAFCYWLAGRHRESRTREWLVLLVLSMATCAVVLGIKSLTGEPVFGAGQARLYLTRLESVCLIDGLVYVSAKPLAFILYAWPLLGVVALSWRRIPTPVRVLFLLTALFPFLLHLFCLLPNTHFSRYSLYFWFPTFLAFSHAWSASPTRRLSSTLILCGYLLLVGGAEQTLRIMNGQGLNSRLLDTFAFTRPGAVARLSDQLCATISCANPPVAVAATEVQIRLRLDERFVVYSLDGLIDDELRRFHTWDGFDHVGYLEHTNSVIVLDILRHGADAPDGLADIARSTASGPVAIRCSVFERIALPQLGTRLSRRTVSPCKPAGSAMPP